VAKSQTGRRARRHSLSDEGQLDYADVLHDAARIALRRIFEDGKAARSREQGPKGGNRRGVRDSGPVDSDAQPARSLATT